MNPTTIISEMLIEEIVRVCKISRVQNSFKSSHFVVAKKFNELETFCLLTKISFQSKKKRDL